MENPGDTLIASLSLLQRGYVVSSSVTRVFGLHGSPLHSVEQCVCVCVSDGMSVQGAFSQHEDWCILSIRLDTRKARKKRKRE